MTCKNAKPSSKSFKLFDGSGLYLEITPSGGKHWKLKYYYVEKEKKLAFGAYPLISLKEATEKREEAKKLLDGNIDPTIKKQEIQSKKQLETENTFKFVAL